VEDGRKVEAGEVVAEDPANQSVPLLAPMAGTVKLSVEQRELTLENVRKSAEQQVSPGEAPESAKAMGAKGARLWKLLRLGAWQFFSDAPTGDLPDPFTAPQAVVVSTFRMDSFVPATEVLLRDRVSEFARGLEHVRGLAGDCKLYLVIPDVKSEISDQFRSIAGERPWIQLFEVPLKYPFGNLKLNAQRLGLDSGKGIVWGLGVEGVLAVDRVLTDSKPCLSRIISVGGPAVGGPAHVETVTGYPVEKICDSFACVSPVRVIDGGALAGETVSAEQRGLDAECLALTIIPENTEREMLAFADPGLTKHAFTRTFFGILRPPFRESYTTAIRGEHRPCVSCSCCEQACPAGIMPFLLHRYVNKNRLEEAQRFGLDLCVECGLCSHVCLAKREMSQAFYEAHEVIREKDRAGEDQT
jgi:Na(+)-translocating NADH:ubiquinone oxidoreductase A subunit